MNRINGIILLLAGFSFISTLCFSQTTADKGKQSIAKKHNFGLYYSANISNSFHELESSDCCVRKVNQKFIYGYALGMSYQYNFNKFISLETGVAYLRTGDEKELIIYDDIGSPPNPDDTVYHKSMNYLVSIPIEYKNYFNLGGNKFFLSTGPTFDLLVADRDVHYKGNNSAGDKYYNEYSSNISDWFDNSIDGWKKELGKLVSMGFTFRMGYEFRIKEKMNISIVPNFRISHLLRYNPTNNAYLPGNYNYSFGLATYIGI